MSKMKLFVAFAVGVAAGALGMYGYLHTKCEKKIKKEVDTAEKFYERKYKCKSVMAENEKKKQVEVAEKEEPQDEPEDEVETIWEPEDRKQWVPGEVVKKYREEAKKYNKTAFDFNLNDMKEELLQDGAPIPYIIEPGEFTDPANDYETCTIHYYPAQNVYTDSEYEELGFEEIDLLIGRNAINHFGEYEPDSVYIRNDALLTDFELIREEGHWEEGGGF